MANKLDLFSGTSNNLSYIDKKSGFIFESIEKCSVVCSETITLGSKSFFLDSEILKEVMNIIEDIDRIVKSAEGEDIHLYEAYIVLLFFDIRKRLDLLSNMIDDIFNNLLSYQNQIKDQCNILSDYWNKKFENTKESGLEELRKVMDPKGINEIFKNFHQYRFLDEEKIFLSTRTFIQYGLCRIDKFLKDKDQSMYKARLIDKSAKTYWSLKWEKEEDSLQTTIVKMTKWKRCLTEEDWSWMMKQENDVMDLAVNGEDLGKNVKINDCYSELFEVMKNYPKLLSEIRKHIHNGRLYDIYSVVDANENLKALLNHENLYLFYRLTLRFNIIMYHIFPELKPQFDEWTNYETKNNIQSDTTPNITAQSSTSNTLPKSVEETFVQPRVLEKHLRKIFNNYINCKPKSVALSYSVLNDYGLLKNFGECKKFVIALVEWGVLPNLDEKKISNLSSQIGAYFRIRISRGQQIPPLPSDFRSWEDNNDKKICENIASVLDDAKFFHYKHRK